MTILSTRDIEDYMGRALAGGELAGASPLCIEIQAQLEGWLGRTLEVAEHTETLMLYPDRGTFVDLSYTPVHSVSSVSVDGVAWVAGTWRRDRSGLFLLSAVNVAVNVNTTDVSEVTVTYTAGLGEPCLSAAKPVLKARLQRMLDKRRSDELGLKSLHIDRYNATWLDEDFFTENELKSLYRWKRKSISSPPAAPLRYDPFSPVGGTYQ